MSQVLSFQLQAIKAAKDQAWQNAIEWNEAILDLRPNDLAALNRLGAAWLQLKQANKARAAFERVLNLDRSNKLAQKHLKRIKRNQDSSVPSFSNESFIEEPGKTKAVELYRLAGKDVLESVSIGRECQLQPKNRYISVLMDDVYIGSLPEDVSFRLTKLIKSGNQYSCRIRSCNGNACTVHLRELSRSQKNRDINSFPVCKNNIAATINDVDESLLDDDIPVEIVETDTDTEKHFDELDTNDRHSD